MACVFTAVCVHFGWDKCRALILSMAVCLMTLCERRVHTSTSVLKETNGVICFLAPLLQSITFVTRNSPLIAHRNLTQPEKPVQSLNGETQGWVVMTDLRFTRS